MTSHPIEALIKAADSAISSENFDALMNFFADDAMLVVKPGLNAVGKEQIKKAFVAIAEHFKNKLVVKQGKMIVLEGADTALVLMETVLEVPGEQDTNEIIRKATYVFRKDGDGHWLCTVDNSYGTELLAQSGAA